jgi:hypothetical protein
VRLFKNKWFTRFAKKEGIKDAELKETVSQLEKGLPAADLGGDVYKLRVARQGEGKAGSYRIIVFFKSKERTFFVYGFAKSKRANIDRGELQIFKDDAKDQLAMTDEQIEVWLRNRILIEIF